MKTDETPCFKNTFNYDSVVIHDKNNSIKLKMR